MSKSIHPGLVSASQFLTHGLGGWNYVSEITDNPQQDLEGMINGFNTSIEANRLETGSAGLFATAAIYEQDNGLSTALVGFPIWKNSQHAEMASQQGHAKTLAYVYQNTGNAFLDNISGTFAFFVSDPANQSLLVGTDRMGNFPVYYTQTKKGVIFGSSANTVLEHPCVAKTITPQGVYSYVYFHMVPSPISIYKNVKKLPAAHYFCVKDGNLTTERYWSPEFNSRRNKSFEQFGKELREELRKSVSRCIQPNQKTASFLSGGLDSSTVTGVLAELSENGSDAYSIGFSADGYDEMAYARITAKHFGVRLHEYYVTPEDVVDALPRIATSYDEPFGNSSALPAWFCADVAAKDGVERLVAGDGGDELFAGNERYAQQAIFENWLQIPKTLRSGFLEPIIAAAPGQIPLADKAKSFISQANTSLPDRLQTYNFLHRHQPSEIFSAQFLNDVDPRAPLAILRKIYNAPAKATALNRMLYLDWQITLADNDLRKVNHMGALAGVEISYPMLDDGLVDFSLQIPDEWKLKRSKLRHFYKESLRGWLPDETISKKKQGFGLPFGVWMQTHAPLRDLAYENLLSLKSRQYFNGEFIDKLIDLHRNGHAAYYGELIWILTVLEFWLAHYNKDDVVQTTH
jgi:asparagine synthase (glutamine-hydrolysing)